MLPASESAEAWGRLNNVLKEAQLVSGGTRTQTQEY